MRRTLFVGLFALSGLALLVSSSPARALVAIGPGMVNPGPARAAQADAVVVGRVVAMEDKDMQVKGATYRIAIVQVTEALKGTAEPMVKVGFIPVKAPNVGNPQIRPLPINRFGPPQLAVGQDGLFFLSKGPDGSFYTVPQAFSFVSSGTPNFKSEVTTAKTAIKVGTNYAAALKSKEATERVFAAAMLIDKYRTPMLKAKLEPIDAAESKLIMKALATADWSSQNYDQAHPWTVFNRLGVTAKDGWTPPKGVRDLDTIKAAAQQWVEKNADSYRIQKNVGGQPIRPGIRPIDRLPPVQIQPGRPIQIQPLPIQIQPLPVPGQPQILPVQPPQRQVQPGRAVKPQID